MLNEFLFGLKLTIWKLAVCVYVVSLGNII